MALNLSENPDDFVGNVVNALTSSLTVELRKKADTAGWPSHLTSSLNVVGEDGVIFVSYPEEFKNDIEDLEFGTMNTPPVSVIRPFIYQASSEVAWALKNELAEDVFENGGVW